MAEVKLGNSVANVDFLWRYMTLDKFINLLDTRKLYFSPLSSYIKSDPFEGYLPKVAFESIKKIVKMEYDELVNTFNSLEHCIENLSIDSENNVSKELLLKGQLKLDGYRKTPKNSFEQIVKGVMVNCWHCSSVESEAMWKLYSEQGKGIAIKTSMISLKSAIELESQDELVQVGCVKYLDFNDDSVSLKDCFTDGHLSPLLKRLAFSHEKEVRLFIIPPNDSSSEVTQKPTLININIEKLIEKIYISPFASQSFVSSVLAISNKFGFDAELVTKSTLLDGHHDLLDLLSL